MPSERPQPWRRCRSQLRTTRPGWLARFLRTRGRVRAAACASRYLSDRLPTFEPTAYGCPEFCRWSTASAGLSCCGPCFWTDPSAFAPECSRGWIHSSFRAGSHISSCWLGALRAYVLRTRPRRLDLLARGFARVGLRWIRQIIWTPSSGWSYGLDFLRCWPHPRSWLPWTSAPGSWVGWSPGLPNSTWIVAARPWGVWETSSTGRVFVWCCTAWRWVSRDI